MLRLLVRGVLHVCLGFLIAGVVLAVAVPLAPNLLGPRSVWIVVVACIALVVAIDRRDRERQEDTQHSNRS
jgi:hypothetical protein